jgi:uncharacterized protein (DUF983 family)
MPEYNLVILWPCKGRVKMGNLSGALNLKCPRCEKGELYEVKNPYKPGKMFAMNTHCNKCGVKYEKEGGFFYGAMYISYAINIALFVTATVGWYLFINGHMDWRIYISTYVGITVLLVPVIFRYSRSIWLMIMIKYEPGKTGER